MVLALFFPSMTESQKQVAFLKVLTLYSDTEQARVWRQRLTEAEHNAQSIRRALTLITWLCVLSTSLLFFEAVMEPELLDGVSRVLTTVMGAVGLASLASLIAFSCIWVYFHEATKRSCDQCRNFILATLDVFHRADQDTSLAFRARNDPARAAATKVAIARSAGVTECCFPADGELREVERPERELVSGASVPASRLHQ